MSHIVKIKTQVKDATAISAACRRLSLAEPTHGKRRIGGENREGICVGLPGWIYPVVIDTSTGEMGYDNYEGSWGEQKELDRFLQAYAVEKTKIEARRKGLSCVETAQADGSVKLTIREFTC